MKTLRLAACIAAAISLSSCATDQQFARTTPATSSHTVVTDSSYVARVEAVARRRGIGITWVNPPSRRLVPSPE